MADWAELETVAPAPIYQTRRFMVPWFDTMGREAGLTAMIIVVRDAGGAPLALLPLAISRLWGLQVAQFLGGKDSNSNTGLFRPDYAPDADEMLAILKRAAGKARPRPDLYFLSNQPMTWDDRVNPLSRLPHQFSPSMCHSTALMADSEAFRNARLSADNRKKLRYKTRKLEEMGPLRLLTARTREEAGRILEAFYEQKLQRFDDKNISSGFDSPQSRAFFARTCISRIGDRESSVELHALLCDGRIIASYGGGEHRGRFHCMFNSFDADPAYSRFSPGDVLLSMLIERKCRQGLHSFDLGIGEGRYKQSWCDQAEALFDTLIGLTAKGRLVASLVAARQALKRAVKQSSWAWPLIVKLREKMPRT